MDKPFLLTLLQVTIKIGASFTPFSYGRLFLATFLSHRFNKGWFPLTHTRYKAYALTCITEIVMNIRYELLPESQQKKLPADQSSLGFGNLRTNHMFVMDYKNGEWQDQRIIPYAPFTDITPGSVALHYGQTIFEGAKAFQHPNGELYTFRYDMNIDRLNQSAEIICMPTVPFDMHMEAAQRLLDIERAWCPTVPESSIYIRPFMFATEDTLGVRPGKTFRFCIMLSPSGPYYAGGFNEAVSLLITKKFHRAVAGGTGEAKCGGNYAAGMLATKAAEDKGCGQVLYLDATNNTIEEAGAMNHYHVLKDGTFIIPQFTGTILRSITSRSMLELAQAGHIVARQEVIQLHDFIAGLQNGEIIEAGGFGTAAVISPVARYVFDDDTSVAVGDGKPGQHSARLYQLYSDIQTGKTPAPEGWMQEVPHFS